MAERARWRAHGEREDTGEQFERMGAAAVIARALELRLEIGPRWCRVKVSRSEWDKYYVIHVYREFETERAVPEVLALGFINWLHNNRDGPPYENVKVASRYCSPNYLIILS